MSSNFGTWEGVLGLNPAINPYVAAIPRQFKQGDSAVWTDVGFVDVNGTSYDSGTYTLKYVLAGPISTPVTLTAVANGSGWKTTLDTATSAGLIAGLYGWQVQVFATGVRITVDEGELTVEADLASAGANYDTRTLAEKALAAAEQALATFQATGGRIQSYTIGNRHMTFQRDADILPIVNYWRGRVSLEKSIATGGRDRMLLARFDRTR